ncbi:hypothetical protein [Flavicella marina]|uniref:hypothetical protein n=1 Tax=Flavicella marina TaxID=1475951 RepID=UPI00126588CE|nr:hypothetical protein [Flavicella marina]
MKKKNIYKLVLTIAAFCFLSSNTQAQTVELTAGYGYQFGSKVNYGLNSYIKLNESDQYSFTIGVDMFKGAMTEVTYIHHSTEIIQSEPGDYRKVTDLNADWILVGASKYLEMEKLRPFFGGGFGMGIFNSNNEHPEVGKIDTKFYLAVAIKAGANYMFNDTWGLNVQGNLMFPIQWGGVYIGTGGAGLSGSSTTLIGGFSGGLVYRIN